MRGGGARGGRGRFRWRRVHAKGGGGGGAAAPLAQPPPAALAAPGRSDPLHHGLVYSLLVICHAANCVLAVDPLGAATTAAVKPRPTPCCAAQLSYARPWLSRPWIT